MLAEGDEAAARGVPGEVEPEPVAVSEGERQVVRNGPGGGSHDGRLEIEDHDGVEAVSEFLRRQPVLGFNTYGEQFNGMHINQSFTGVAIGRPGRG